MTTILKFKNSKRFPVTAMWPAVQPVYARTSKTVGARGPVFVEQGCVDRDGCVLVQLCWRHSGRSIRSVQRCSTSSRTVRIRLE
jgi:hypothetical protein